jgi:tetratricopeptide (TPR) repeat protein
MSFLFARRTELHRLLFFLSIALLLALVLNSNSFSQDPDPETEALVYFNKGQDAHEKKDFALAIENYDKAIKLVPDFPEAELQRGNALVSIGRLDDAETSFRRALELRDGWSLAQANLGSLLVQTKKYVEAEKFLTKAIENEELNFPAYTAMTELRLKTKASPAVLSALLTKDTGADFKGKSHCVDLGRRGQLWKRSSGDKKLAKASAARALELDNKNLTALTVSADLALSGKRSHGRRSIRQAARDPRTGFRTYQRTPGPHPGSPRKARRRPRCAQLDHESGPEIIDLKNQLTATKTVDVGELEKQLSTDLKNPVILAKLCTAYRVSDPNKSLDYCRQSAEASPNEVQPIVGYGAALVQAKRYDEATLVLRRLLTIAPDNATREGQPRDGSFSIEALSGSENRISLAHRSSTGTVHRLLFPRDRPRPTERVPRRGGKLPYVFEARGPGI